MWVGWLVRRWFRHVWSFVLIIISFLLLVVKPGALWWTIQQLHESQPAPSCDGVEVLVARLINWIIPRWNRRDQSVRLYWNVLIVLQCLLENVDPKMSLLVCQVTAVSLVCWQSSGSHWNYVTELLLWNHYIRIFQNWNQHSELALASPGELVMTEKTLWLPRWQFYPKRRLRPRKVRQKQARNMVMLR